MNSMVVRDLLQGIVFVEVIGQTVSIHLAEERRLTRQRERQNPDLQRHYTTVGDCDPTCAEAENSIERNIDIGNDGVIRVGLQCHDLDFVRLIRGDR